MNNRSKVLVLASLVITTCLVLITLSTYALFTDTINIGHHLQAGSLNIGLKRINLKYNYLNSDGYLVDVENNKIVDFTNTSTNDSNIFDINNDTLIVPGSYYHASMQLENKGSVSFIYWIEIIIKDEIASDLASQLEIIVTTYDEELNKTEYKAFLKEGLVIGSEKIPLGEMGLNASPLNFDIKISFIDSTLNNSAQNDSVNFDIIVHAVQKIN